MNSSLKDCPDARRVLDEYGTFCVAYKSINDPRWYWQYCVFRDSFALDSEVNVLYSEWRHLICDSPIVKILDRLVPISKGRELCLLMLRLHGYERLNVPHSEVLFASHADDIRRVVGNPLAPVDRPK